MSALLLEGFDHYGTGAASVTNMQVSSAYVDVQTTTVGPTYCGVPSWGTAYTGPYCLVSKSDLKANKAYAARIIAQNNSTAYYMSLRYAMDSMPVNGNTTTIVDFRNSSNAIMAVLAVATDGSIQLRNSSGTVLGTTTALLTAQKFYFLEMCWDSGNTKFTLRVNDTFATLTPALTVTNAVVNTLRYVGLLPCVDTTSGDAGLFQYQYIDDLYLRDNAISNQGDSNTSWLGDYRILYLPVISDVSVSNWTSTPGGVTASSVLGKTVPNDATYMASTTASSSSMRFKIGTVPAATGFISAISLVTRGQTDSTATRFTVGFTGSLNNSLTSSTLTFAATNTVATQNLLIFQADPDTGANVAPSTMTFGNFVITRTV